MLRIWQSTPVQALGQIQVLVIGSKVPPL
jgi:hypothetical protein